MLVAALIVAACVYPIKALSRLSQQHAAADREWMEMQALAAKAAQLQEDIKAQAMQVPNNPVELLRSLVSQQFGDSASVQAAGESVVISLNKASAVSLAQGLELVRTETKSIYTGAKISVVDGLATGSLDLRLPVVR